MYLVSPRGFMDLSGDVCDCHNGGAAGIYRIEVRVLQNTLRRTGQPLQVAVPTASLLQTPHLENGTQVRPARSTKAPPDPGAQRPRQAKHSMPSATAQPQYKTNAGDAQ